jgi:DNA-binding response OmpR family regulator
MRLLVVEDHEVLATAIAAGLRREGMAVDLALCGQEALDRLSGIRYDVVVLDRDLPGVHGDEVCRRIVAGDSGSRVLMLTAAGTIRDKVDGLGLGADDYLAKPFDVRVAASLGPAIVTGDPALAESLVANLVDNAVRHNRPDGHVHVTTGTHSGRPWFCASNSGPVVPPGEVGRLLEPFQQLDRERTCHDGGHGLGLAIVAAVASAHAADLAVRARPEGGLDVTVTFRS